MSLYCFRKRRRNNCGQRPRLQISGVTTLIAMTLLLLGDAPAKGSYKVYPASTQTILVVKKASGLVLSVTATAQSVQFKFDGLTSDVKYSTKGHVSGQRVDATFGRLGRIHVKLDLIGYPPGPVRRGRCQGRAPLFKEGSYSGIIEFAGEGQHVPSVSIRHGRVYVRHRFRKVCRRAKHEPAKPEEKRLKNEVSVLSMKAHAADRTVLLQGFEVSPAGEPGRARGYFVATAFERREMMGVASSTGTSIDHKAFLLSKPGESPLTALVELSSPFAGHAVYSASPGMPPTWTGDLSVNLSGIGRVPLTGLGFTPLLCRTFSPERIEACLDTDRMETEVLRSRAK
jgi:hypothetical protein